MKKEKHSKSCAHQEKKGHGIHNMFTALDEKCAKEKRREGSGVSGKNIVRMESKDSHENRESRKVKRSKTLDFNEGKDDLRKRIDVTPIIHNDHGEISS